MTIDINDLDILDLMAQSQKIYRITEFCTQYDPPDLLGKGCNLVIQLRGGLNIHILEGNLPQPLTVRRKHQEQFPVIAKFYLSGDSRVKTKNAPERLADYEEVAGCNYLYYLPDVVEAEEWKPHEPTQVVMIYADLNYFRAIDPADRILPPSLQRLLRENGRFHQPLGKMTLAMNQVLRQILHCPYQGITQQLYLECKALELLALQFDRLEADAPEPRQLALKPKELERVERARDLLVQQAKNPPLLKELAYQVGLSERKLTQGFRHLFGTTVCGYLSDYRLEQARDLLHQSHITVAQVAARVGYRNPEAFSTAFRRKFDIPPKAYQLGRR